MKRALTSKILDAALKARIPVAYGDSVAANLTVRIVSNGKALWYWYGKVNGKPVRVPLGEYPELGVTEARAKAVEFTERRDEAKQNGVPFEIEQQRQRKPKLVISNPEDVLVPVASDAPAAAPLVLVSNSGERTCQWLWDEYMRHEGAAKDPAKVKPGQKATGTAKEKQRCWNKDIKPFIGDKPYASITYDDLADIIADKAEEAPGAASHLVSYIQRLFNWAVREGRIYTRLETNPAANLMKPKKTEERDRYLNEDEIKLFFKAVDGQDDTFTQCLTLTLYTGTRRTESAHMTWGEYNHKNGHWLIPGVRTKNEDPLLLPLPRTMQDLLDERKKVCGDGSYVFRAVQADKPITGFSKYQNRLRERMNEIATEEAGRPVEIPNWTIHDLRRTLSTNLNGLLDKDERALVPFEIVERITNHRMGKVQRTYNHHPYMIEKRQALAHWADHLDKLRREALACNKARRREAIA